MLQLTAEGNNEDPSWAPDGRHLVFSGERSYGYGLFVVDAATGRIRPSGFQHSIQCSGMVSLPGRDRWRRRCAEGDFEVYALV